MKTLFSLLVTLFCFSANNALANEDVLAQASYCKATANGACAVSTRTGQCTMAFNKRDHENPMYACKIYTGEVSNRIDRNNYYCSGNADRACARSKIHGQCTHEWTSRDGAGNAMYQCQRWMNPNMGRVDRSNYVCTGDSQRVCAKDIRTGQCFHVWTARDGGDPWFFCRKWIGR